jgi:hypothetical protein
MTSRRTFLSLLPMSVAATSMATSLAAATTRAHERRSSFVSPSWQPGSVRLAGNGRAAPIVVSAGDHPGVVRVVNGLQADVESPSPGRAARASRCGPWSRTRTCRAGS